jgi:hypothetical protein
MLLRLDIITTLETDRTKFERPVKSASGVAKGRDRGGNYKKPRGFSQISNVGKFLKYPLVKKHARL